MIINIIMLFAGVVLFLLSPSILLAVLLVNFLVSTFVLIVQFISSLLPNKYKDRKRVNLKDQKFVSIHVPTYNEPPYIVKNTLKALSRLDYQNYEVIIIDNNTKDKKVWEPIEQYCKELGPQFRFVHVNKLKGFKAGALNYILRSIKVNPDSQFVAVIDADYIVKSDFIKKALQYFTDEQIGFVQFPQAFYNVGKGNKGVTLEYKHFFMTYMNMSNYMGSLLTTGTLTVFRYKAIEEAGKFNTHALTEDAEIGLKLNMVGYKGVYVNEVIGEGLMPYDLESYEKQKRRWSMGNAQIIKDNILKVLLSKRFIWKEKVAIFAQLTAWLNFCLLPVFAVISSALSSLITERFSGRRDLILLISFLTLASYIAFKLASFLLIFRREGYSTISAIRALLVHIGMQEVYSYALWTTLLSPNSEFIRTNKFFNSDTGHLLSGVLNEVILIFAAFFAGIYFLHTGNLVGLASALIIIFLFSLIFYVAFEFRYTRRYSELAFKRLNIKADKL